MYPALNHAVITPDLVLGPHSVLPFDDADYIATTLRGLSRLRVHPVRKWVYAVSLLVCGLSIARATALVSERVQTPILKPIVVLAPTRAEWPLELRSDTVATILVNKNVDPDTAARWAREFVFYGEQAHINAKLLVAVAYTESEFNPRARSNAGAIGLMQVLPERDSWREYEPRCGIMTAQRLHEPKVNICFGAHILREFLTRHHGDTDHALAAYNNGSGKLNKYPGRVYASFASLTGSRLDE